MVVPLSATNLYASALNSLQQGLVAALCRANTFKPPETGVPLFDATTRARIETAMYCCRKITSLWGEDMARLWLWAAHPALLEGRTPIEILETAVAVDDPGFDLVKQAAEICYDRNTSPSRLI